MRLPDTLAEQLSLQESTEERFTAIFGAHRTPFSSRPEGIRPPDAKDYEASTRVDFTDTPNRLHHLEVEDDYGPFLWVTDGGVREHGRILYCASHHCWHEDTKQQLTELAAALCIRRQDFSPVYATEWVASSSETAERLCFPIVSGKYVRLVGPSALSTSSAYWESDEFSSDPARAWEEIATALIHGTT